MIKTLILSLCLALFPCIGFSQNAQIRLKVSGIEEAIGNICFALYQNEENYNSESPFMGDCIAVDSINFEYVITDVPPGTYAISLFQDKDKNKDLNTNWIGMPKEPFGFSNDAKGRLRPPNFEDASFVVTDDITIEINLIEL